VAVGRASAGASPYAFAAASPSTIANGYGLYRREGTSWVRVLTAYSGATLDFAPISYPNNLGQTLYTYDRNSGNLWRSNSQGALGTWVSVWTAPPAEVGTGYIATDPNATGTVWVTTAAQGKVYRLTGCKTGPCSVQTITTFADQPGPIAITSTGAVYVATRAVTGATVADLWRTTNTGGSWQNLTAGTMYEGAAMFPKQVAIAVSGSAATAYVTTLGNGVVVVTGA
jgi:hypothetical protein